MLQRVHVSDLTDSIEVEDAHNVSETKAIAQACNSYMPTCN